MDLAGVKDFVFDYVPRKVSTDPENAAEIIWQFALFWASLNREHHLPRAQQIVEWLRLDGIVGRLEHELADPRNYGMAKSIFMSGMAAGFDMTSEEGMNQYMLAYNASLARLDPPDPEQPFTPELFKGRSVGRNDHCACGSGKKYKKCCKNKC